MPHQDFSRVKVRRTGGLGFAVLAAVLFWAWFPAVSLAYEANKNAVAQLVVKNARGETVSTGSGFVVAPEGVLVTNYHVLVDASGIDALFPDGRQVPVAGILKVDRVRDFALLKLAEGFYSTLEIGDSRRLKEFDYTSALGFPSEGDGGAQAVLETHGFVLGIHPQAYPDVAYIYTSTPFGPGFSGGPLLDRDNKVVGIATLAGRSINLALPIDEIRPFLKTGQSLSFAELLEQDKSSMEALYYRGNFLLYAMGDLEESRRLFEEVLKKDPGFALAHYDLAAVHRDMGDMEQAIASYEKTLALQPNFPEALSNLGGFYYRAGQVEKARATFERALAVYPNFVQGLSNLGAVLNKLERPQEARSLLEKALRLDPEFAVAYFNLGNACFALGRLDEAEAAYNRSMAMGVDFLAMHWKLYEIHVRKDNPAEAVRQLNIILEMDPENREAREKLEQAAPAPAP